MSITYLSPSGIWGEDKHYFYNTKVVKFLFLAKKRGRKVVVEKSEIREK